MRDIVRQVAVVLSTIGVIAINALASALPLNGQTTGEISDQFDVYFVPAGYVFSIWGLIYLGLIAYSIYQALPAQRDNPLLRRTGWLYVLSCVANVAWLFLWHYEYFEWTLVAMVALLLLLIAIYLRLGTGRTGASRAENWLVRLPFSIYLGWITVATIANVTSLLEYLGWGGWGLAPEWWAVIMLVAAAIITTLVSLTRGDVAYVAVIVWATIGIALKHSDTLSVSLTAWIVAAWVALTLILGVPLRMERLANWEEVQRSEGVRDRW
ncbi:MAG: tryptophan-rich sensory protein [Anaerolineae bacterium]|jgi:cell division protein FtsW (lipid II flippase)